MNRASSTGLGLLHEGIVLFTTKLKKTTKTNRHLLSAGFGEVWRVLGGDCDNE